MLRDIRVTVGNYVARLAISVEVSYHERIALENHGTSNAKAARSAPQKNLQNRADQRR